MNEHDKLLKVFNKQANKQLLIFYINQLRECNMKQYKLNKNTAEHIIRLTNIIKELPNVPYTRNFIAKPAVQRMINAAKKKVSIY